MAKGRTIGEQWLAFEREVARKMYREGHRCPECQAKGPHDDNGRRGEELSWCCTACGNHWDAVQFRGEVAP
jgi:ribosomal protein L37AE/L43A